jgi:hypothetical protein
MVKMEAGQVVEVELDGKWWITKVQEVSMLILLMKTHITPPPPAQLPRMKRLNYR